MTKDELIEQLADKEHASWARWMNYVFDLGTTNEDGSFTIPSESVQRWLRQANTNYADLSEREKQSDREEVALILPIIEEYAGGMAIDAVNHTVDRLVKRPLDLIDQAKLASSLAVLEARVNILEKARHDDTRGIS